MNNLSTGNVRVHVADIIADVDYSYELEDEIEVNLDSVILYQRQSDPYAYHEMDLSTTSALLKEQSFYNHLISAIRAKENI
jgi:hypothetical protein